MATISHEQCADCDSLLLQHELRVPDSDSSGWSRMTVPENVRLHGVRAESIVHISTWEVTDDRDDEGDYARGRDE